MTRGILLNTPQTKECSLTRKTNKPKPNSQHAKQPFFKQKSPQSNKHKSNVAKRQTLRRGMDSNVTLSKRDCRPTRYKRTL